MMVERIAVTNRSAERAPVRGAVPRATASGLGALALAFAAICGSTQAPAADLAAGRAMAESQCATCHGVDGVASAPDAPNLAGDSAYYLQAQLEAYRDGQRAHQQMSIIASGLSDADIANLAAWYAAIEVETTLPEAGG